MALEKPGKLRNFFLLLCGHPVILTLQASLLFAQRVRLLVLNVAFSRHVIRFLTFVLCDMAGIHNLFF